MPVAPILRYPNPLLKQRCAPIDEPEEIARIAATLVDTMRSQPRCVGLAAPQVGELARIAVVDVTGHAKATSCSGLLVLVNPAILRSEGEELGREGCLSVPELTANVRRATVVEVEALSPDGAPFTVEADGFEARALQHELDHLDGILFLDRIASKQDLFQRKSFGSARPIGTKPAAGSSFETVFKRPAPAEPPTQGRFYVCQVGALAVSVW